MEKQSYAVCFAVGFSEIRMVNLKDPLANPACMALNACRKLTKSVPMLAALRVGWFGGEGGWEGVDG